MASIQYNFISINKTYCILHGRIKDENNTVSAIKWLVCCVGKQLQYGCVN